jgi:hypothetical protein
VHLSLPRQLESGTHPAAVPSRPGSSAFHRIMSVFSSPITRSGSADIVRRWIQFSSIDPSQRVQAGLPTVVAAVPNVRKESSAFKNSNSPPPLINGHGAARALSANPAPRRRPH